MKVRLSRFVALALTWGVADVATAQSRGVDERIPIEQLETDRTKDEKLHHLYMLDGRKSDAAAQAVAKEVRREANDPEVKSRALRMLCDMHTPRAHQLLVEIVDDPSVPATLRGQAVEGLWLALNMSGDGEIAARIDAWMRCRACPRPVVEAARRGRPSPGALETLSNLEVRSIREMARKEAARLRSLDQALPLVDIALLDGWRRERVASLSAEARSMKESKGLRNDPRIRFKDQQVAKLRAFRVRDLGAELLAQFYDATGRSRSAALAAAKLADAAETAKDLPTIEWTEEQHERIRGQDVVTGTREGEFDLSILSSLARAAANDAILASIQATRHAEELHALLAALSLEGIELVKQQYVKSISSDPRVGALRNEKDK
ncbi:MAG: hypothetical protein FJ255_08250 [Phycisphaerae bacterium]|nr:hypothetical protein [Phycisphaerae bacterium]